MKSGEYSRPATIDDLKLLIRSLNENKAEYLLIGGYALFAHGYHRATTDIDLLVPADRQSAERIKDALLVLPDHAAEAIDPTWFDEGENIRVADEIVVDLVLSACGRTYENLLPYEETIVIDGIPVRTLNLEGLLKTKQASRGKDAEDRALLEQAIARMKRGDGR